MGKAERTRDETAKAGPKETKTTVVRHEGRQVGRETSRHLSQHVHVLG